MKDIAVIGLGRFGTSVARRYTEMGGNVLAIDNDMEKVQEISEFVTYAVRADVTDAEEVRSLGLSDMDVVVIAIGSNMEASVMATILAKEEGVSKVVAKSYSDLHEKVLKKVGADIIIFPEKEMGVRVARRIAVDKLMETIELSDDYSIAEVKIPNEWVGKSIISLDLRKKYQINVLAMKEAGKINIQINPNAPFEEDAILVVIGRNRVIERIFT